MNKIDDIRQRRKASTPGHWYVNTNGSVQAGREIIIDWWVKNRGGDLYDGGIRYYKEADKNFIVNAGTDIDFLISEVERLERELKEKQVNNNEF